MLVRGINCLMVTSSEESMSHKDMTSFSCEIPLEDEKKMQEFQEMMDQLTQETVIYERKLAEELGVPVAQVGNIVYLRTRSRWSQELEDRLVKAYKSGATDISVLSGEEEEDLQRLGF